MTVPFDIEQLQIAHYELIRALWKEAGLPTRYGGRDSRASLERELAQTRNFVLGAFDGEALVAVVLGSDDGRKGWINRLAVKPSHRRRGVGRLLVERCEELFRARGLGLCCCLVEDGNDGSFALFEQAGYAVRRDIDYLRKPLGDESW